MQIHRFFPLNPPFFDFCQIEAKSNLPPLPQVCCQLEPRFGVPFTIHLQNLVAKIKNTQSNISSDSCLIDHYIQNQRHMHVQKGAEPSNFRKQRRLCNSRQAQAYSGYDQFQKFLPDISTKVMHYLTKNGNVFDFFPQLILKNFTIRRTLCQTHFFRILAILHLHLILNTGRCCRLTASCGTAGCRLVPISNGLVPVSTTSENKVEFIFN